MKFVNLLTEAELQAALGEDEEEEMDMDDEDDEDNSKEGEISQPRTKNSVYRLVAPGTQASRWWPAEHRSWEMPLPVSKS